MKNHDRLRFAFFPGLLGPSGGGASQSACLHATSLAERGLSVFVEGFDDPSGGLADLTLHSCDAREHAWSGSIEEPASPALLDRARVVLGMVDVVHLNGHYQKWLHDVARLCREAGVPYVISSRATLDPSALANQPANRLAALADGEVEYVAGALAIHVTSRVEHMRAADQLCGHPNIVTIPNAVDLDGLRTDVGRAEARRRLGIPDGPVLLYFGRLIPQKQPHYAVDVLARLPADHRLFVVGDNDDKARKELLAHAHAAGVADRVDVVDHAHGRDRSLWLVAADVLLVPSLMENFCLAMVEAVALGLPVVAAEHVGATEYLDVGDVRVAPRELDAWAVAVTDALTQEHVDRDETFARVREKFRPASVLSRWAPIYESIEPQVPRDVHYTLRRDLVRFAKDNWSDVPAVVSRFQVVDEISGGASSRVFFRLTDEIGHRAVAMACPERQSDFLAAPFDSTRTLDWLQVHSAFDVAGLPVPRVLAADESRGLLLVEDLGASRLDLEIAARPTEARALLDSAVDLILELQMSTKALPSGSLPLRRRLDVPTLVWEMFHYVEWGVEARFGVRVSAADRLALLDEFSRIAEEIAGSSSVLVHRDFNATNLVPRRNGWGLVDFDDALLGSMAYDLCSLLLDVNLSIDRDQVAYHIAAFHSRRAGLLPATPGPSEFERLFDLQAVQRNLKVAGRFVWLDHLGGTSRYVDHVDTAVNHVFYHLSRHDDLSDLARTLSRIAAKQ